MIEKIKAVLLRNPYFYIIDKARKDPEYKAYCLEYDYNGTIFRFEHLGDLNFDKNIYILREGGSYQGMFSILTWTLRRLEVADRLNMIPYNKKIYGYEFENLGTYWLEKLPNVSFEETLKSCLTHKAYGKQPGHATFMYPKKYGYGELWTRMAETIKDNIVFNQCVKEINIKTKSVETADGQIYSAETIITSIPWETLSNISGAPDYIICSIKELKRNSIQIDYYADNLDTDAHWIYYPDSNISFHRILNKRTFSPLGGGYWTETNVNRIEKRNEVTPIFSYVNEYAYPLNTINKPDIMKSLIEFFTNLNIFPLGRWGEHQHYNSDVVVEKALNLSNSLPV